MSTSHPIRRSVKIALVLAALGVAFLAYVGLQRAPETAEEPPSPAVTAHPPEPSRAEADSELAPPELELPEWGGLVVQGDAGALTLLVNGVPPRAILAEISDHLDFGMSIHVPLDERRISLQAVEERLEAVLARILRDTPYALYYEASEEGRDVALARLVIGEPEVRVAVAPDRREDRRALTPEERKNLEAIRDEERQARRAEKLARREARLAERGPRAKPSAAETRQALQARALRQQERHQETLAALDDPDPEERSFAVFSLDATDRGDLIYIGEALTKDPDPLVREEAARQLAFGETSAVLPLLRKALEDPSNDVVLAAIDSIGFAGDPSIIPDLEPLLQHQNGVVQDEAQDTIEFFQLFAR